MAIYLAVSLRGVAQELFCDLTSEDRRSYTALVRNLAERFGSEGQTELFQMQLKSRMRLPRETLSELAQGIKRLVARVYPQAVTLLMEVLAMDHFIDALHNSESRLRLKQNKPRNLEMKLYVWPLSLKRSKKLRLNKQEQQARNIYA